MSLRKTGYMDSEVVGCQFSVYPLRQESIDAPVQAAIKAAAEHCSVRVGNLSTLMWGDEDQVFAGLRQAYKAVQEYGSAVLIATLAAGIPGDELVSSIQADVNKETNTNEAAQPNRGASESAAAKGRE
jgi:uncharacterized protein YqgV (UPF0045/DUF77 family)